MVKGVILMKICRWKYEYQDIEDNQNQYTIEECKRNGFVDAKYIKSTNRKSNGNPFIEALPRPRNMKHSSPYFRPIAPVDYLKFKDLTTEEKKEEVLYLKELRLPLSFQKELEFVNYDVMTNSYSLRNIYYWSSYVFNETIEQKNFELQTKLKGQVADSAPSGFSLLGESGCGKSTAIKELFNNMPQLIAHHPKEGMVIPQITYIVVACVPNSNFRLLYTQIGEAIDFVLGNAEPCYERLISKQRNLGDMQMKVCELIEKFSIGTIVLDEIQLVNFKSNRENTYEALLSIVNKTKVALSVVGTEDAYNLLFSKLRNARRSGEYINASAYTQNKAYFSKLTWILFKWQWFDEKVEWTQELSDTLFDCSKGLINQLIWIYKWMNLEYIEAKANGQNVVVDCDYIRNINNKHFMHLKSQLDLMEQEQIEQLEDQKIIEAVKAKSNQNYEPEDISSLDLIGEAKITSEVIEMVHHMFPQFDSDLIASATKQVLENDKDHKLRTYEIAQQTLDILQNKPAKKKRRTNKKKPTSKDITAYLDL